MKDLKRLEEKIRLHIKMYEEEISWIKSLNEGENKERLLEAARRCKASAEQVLQTLSESKS